MGKQSCFVDKTFLRFITDELYVAIGPIAEVLMEETAIELGFDLFHIPTDNAPEFIDVLSRHILREEKKFSFQKKMVVKLNETAQQTAPTGESPEYDLPEI